MLVLLSAACSSARSPQHVVPQPADIPALRFIISEAFDANWELRVTMLAGEQLTGHVRGFHPNGFELDNARIDLDGVMSVERRGPGGYILDFTIGFAALGGAVGYALTSGATGSSNACKSPCREQRIALFVAGGAIVGGVLGAILKRGQDHELLWQRQ